MGLIRTINNGYAEYSAAVGFIHLTELDNLPRNVTIGSIIHVIETGERYIFDDTKTWCLLNLGCGNESGTGLKYVVVEELPPIEQASGNTIYMIKNEDHYDCYIKSGDIYVQISDTLSIPENLVTLDDLEDYVKKTELTDGSIEDIVVNNTISAQEFIEDNVSLKNKYLQKAELAAGTTNFKNINADNVYITNKLTSEEAEITDAEFDKVTINQLLKLAFGASVEGHKWSISADGDILCDSLSIDNANGITIANENIYEYVKRIAKQYGGESPEDIYVLKAGDTMTGSLYMNDGSGQHRFDGTGLLLQNYKANGDLMGTANLYHNSVRYQVNNSDGTTTSFTAENDSFIMQSHGNTFFMTTPQITSITASNKFEVNGAKTLFNVGNFFIKKGAGQKAYYLADFDNPTAAEEIATIGDITTATSGYIPNIGNTTTGDFTLNRGNVSFVSLTPTEDAAESNYKANILKSYYINSSNVEKKAILEVIPEKISMTINDNIECFALSSEGFYINYGIGRTLVVNNSVFENRSNTVTFSPTSVFQVSNSSYSTLAFVDSALMLSKSGNSVLYISPDHFAYDTKTNAGVTQTQFYISGSMWTIANSTAAPFSIYQNDTTLTFSGSNYSYNTTSMGLDIRVCKTTSGSTTTSTSLILQESVLALGFKGNTGNSNIVLNPSVFSVKLPSSNHTLTYTGSMFTSSASTSTQLRGFDLYDKNGDNVVVKKMGSHFFSITDTERTIEALMTDIAAFENQAVDDIGIVLEFNNGTYNFRGNKIYELTVDTDKIKTITFRNCIFDIAFENEYGNFSILTGNYIFENCLFRGDDGDHYIGFGAGSQTADDRCDVQINGCIANEYVQFIFRSQGYVIANDSFFGTDVRIICNCEGEDMANIRNKINGCCFRTKLILKSGAISALPSSENMICNCSIEEYNTAELGAVDKSVKWNNVITTTIDS